ncbi:MAG: hypothetical protein ACRD6X_20530, partial [Pyrinomonadaceae bacterium]
MNDTTILISALETAPGVIIPLIREVPPRILKRRPSPAKWSAYENAVHLSQSDASFRERLELILSMPEPFIKTIHNSPEDEAGAMLDIDLDESLDRYVRERVNESTPLNYGENITMLAAISLSGIDAPMTIEGAVDGIVFKTYVEQVARPDSQ